MCGTKSFVHNVMKDPIDYNKVLANGQQQCTHQNAYGHFTTQVRTTCYTKAIGKIGIATHNINLIDMNDLMMKFFILRRENKT